MRLCGWLVLALLLGCADPADDNYGYGWHYDAEGETGLRLRYEPDVRADRRRDLAAFETAWRETAACLARTPAPPGPLVIVVPNAFPCQQRDGWCTGVAFPDTDTAVVHAGLADLRHEYVHLLLDTIGHADPRVATCGAPGPEAIWTVSLPGVP